MQIRMNLLDNEITKTDSFKNQLENIDQIEG